MKILFALFALAAASGGGWFWWQSSQPEEISYMTAQVGTGDLTQNVIATGLLNPVRTVSLGSQISGNISKLYKDFNSVVKAHDLVAEIDPILYKAALKQAQGDLKNAQAGEELAQINAQRAEELRKENVIPQSQLDVAIANLHQASAQVKIKEGALALAVANLNNCKIYSPIDGTVITRVVDVGQTVAASLSAPVIFTLANDLTKMQIDASVAEADVGIIAEGYDVDFTVDAFPYQTFHGKVVQIRNSSTTVQNVVTYDTVISVNNDDLKLRPGMTASLFIIVAKHQNVLKMPNGAMRYHPPDVAASTGTPVKEKRGNKEGGKRAGEHRPGHAAEPPQIERTVYVLHNDKPDAKPVPIKIKTGINDGIFTEVVDGLKEGDTVVTGTNTAEPEIAAANGKSNSGSNLLSGMKR